MTLRWPDLPVLSLRLHVAHAIRSLPQDYAGYRRDEQAQAVLDRLAKLAAADAPGQEEYRVVPAGEAAEFAFLGDYFIKVGSELTAREAHRGAASPKAKELLDALGPVLGRSPCVGCCKAGSATVCKWTADSRPADERLLKASPKCLDPARAVFDMANELARDAYKLASDSDALPFVLSLDVVKIGGAANGPPIDGQTCEGAEPHLRTVELRVRAESFSHVEYLTLPYLFVHECVAHGYCGVRLDVDEHHLSLNFQEGWMDEAASLLLKDALGSEYAEVPGLESWLGRVEALEAMDANRRVRNSFAARPNNGTAALIEEGVAAFKAFCYCLDAAQGVPSHLRPSQTATAFAVEFSLLLNSSYVSHDLRGAFVERIASLYDRGDRSARQVALENQPAVLDICRRYLSSSRTFRDVESLVTEVVAIGG